MPCEPTAAVNEPEAYTHPSSGMFIYIWIAFVNSTLRLLRFGACTVFVVVVFYFVRNVRKEKLGTTHQHHLHIHQLIDSRTLQN